MKIEEIRKQVLLQNPGSRLVLPLCLVAGVLLVYLPHILSLDEFITDDFYHLALTSQYGVVHPFMGEVFYYFAGIRVIPGLTLLMDYHLYGTTATGYYVTNLVIFVTFIVVTYHLFRRLYVDVFGLEDVWPTFIVITLMIVHSEFGTAAWWISNRTESLMLLSYSLSIMALIGFIKSARWVFLLLACIAFIFALFSKAQPSHLPLLFLFLWYVYRKQGKTEINVRTAMLASVPLFLTTISYTVIAIQYDTRLAMVPWQYIPEKMMAIAGISMIAVAPMISEGIYAFFVHNKLVAYATAPFLVIGLLLLLVNVNRRNRIVILALISLFLITLYPRIAYVVYERINSIQAMVWLFVLGLLLHQIRQKRAFILGGLLIVMYLYGGIETMRLWKDQMNNTRYLELIEREDENHKNYYKLISHQVFDPYAMHFHRYGTFGYDSTFHNSPVLIDLKYGSYAGLDYDVAHIPGGFRFISHDNRTTFMYDSSNTPRYGMNVQVVEQEKDYEYLGIDMTFEGEVRDVTFLIERNFLYETIKPYGDDLPVSK